MLHFILMLSKLFCKLWPVISFAICDIAIVSSPRNDCVAHASLSDQQVMMLFNSINYESDIVLDNFFSTQYFSHLKTNFGNNSHGTCTYTSLGMMLSFYDTYWDDNIIPENYDAVSESISPDYSNCVKDLPSFDAESPGVYFEDYNEVSGLTDEQYLSYVSSHDDTFFQSKLISISQVFFNSGIYDFGLTFEKTIALIKHYLYDYRNYNNSNMPVFAVTGDTQLTKTFTIDEIRNGRPVLITATSDYFNCHAMIAYDFDENTNEIFVHPGWKNNEGKALTHVSLSQLGVTGISNALSIHTEYCNSPSNNYHSSRGNYLSSDLFAFPQDIVIVSGNYRDTTPAFKWKSLSAEKWSNYQESSVCIEFFNFYNDEIFKKVFDEEHLYTLTEEQWDTVVNRTTEPSYYIKAYLVTWFVNDWGQYPYLITMNKPKIYQNVPFIEPHQYNFPNAYANDEETSTTFVSHTTSNGFTFKTRRYRVGYINNEYIVMSPKRKGFFEAYIEYAFTYGITRIDVSLSYWRDKTFEGINQSNGEAYIQYLYVNQYINVFDLLDPSNSMPENRNEQKTYIIEFPSPVYRIRFYSSMFKLGTNNSNRGRICIGNIAFYEDTSTMPLSGYELDYDSEIWKYYQSSTNCFGYAFNAFGYWIESHLRFQNIPDQSYFINDIINIAHNCGCGFERIGKYQKCSQNYYKVAFVASSTEGDIHWYRQNSDGTWSHKIASLPVQYSDFSGYTIYDPETCNRHGEGLFANYDVFLGFFQLDITNSVWSGNSEGYSNA